jgi:hypothetical protein
MTRQKIPIKDLKICVTSLNKQLASHLTQRLRGKIKTAGNIKLTHHAVCASLDGLTF